MVHVIETYMKRRIAFFTVGLSVLGVTLVLLGSIIEVPYTTRETFNNYPHYSPDIWENDTITLQPYTVRAYSLDLMNLNESIVYLRIKATNPIILQIEGDYGGFYNVSDTVMIKKYIPPAPPLPHPFEFFWTPPFDGSMWDFVFINPFDTTTNVTFQIIIYYYNLEWEEDVTRYRTPLDRSFAYAGIIAMIAAIVPPAYDLYKTRKKTPKEILWRDEAEGIREKEEMGKQIKFKMQTNL